MLRPVPLVLEAEQDEVRTPPQSPLLEPRNPPALVRRYAFHVDVNLPHMRPRVLFPEPHRLENPGPGAQSPEVVASASPDGPRRIPNPGRRL